MACCNSNVDYTASSYALSDYALTGCSSCPYPEWVQPILCNQTRFISAEEENGATLVIHKIVLEPLADQSCTPRTFSIRVTGPSYPCGELFQLRVGSCTELDEPLVITGLTPGQYSIEEVFSNPNEFITTITGPVCGRCVLLTASSVPTVVTLVNRRRLCRLCNSRCGCGAY